jgi:NAD(P)-dependent dehydrogenase (short-subunit alcohol dehydrogenase family)
MTELRFDDRVVIVTGAGRGIGRAYARLLAARGAAVVVNDLGGTTAGAGADAAPADAVVAEIAAAGGTASADHHDVADPDGAAALVAGAVERHGRLDAVVNNAGIMRWAAFPDVTADDLDVHLDVHLRGSLAVTRAAWPHLVASGAGRVVMTTSAGVFGLAANLAYATAKAALIGMTHSMSLAGAADGVRVNLIAPAAMTRMAGPSADDDAEGPMSPDLVAPMVAYLAHPDCPVSGECFAAGAGRFARIVMATSDGYLHDGPAPTPEDVAVHWAEIDDVSAPWVPADLMEWSRRFTGHLGSDR